MFSPIHAANRYKNAALPGLESVTVVRQRFESERDHSMFGLSADQPKSHSVKLDLESRSPSDALLLVAAV